MRAWVAVAGSLVVAGCSAGGSDAKGLERSSVRFSLSTTNLSDKSVRICGSRPAPMPDQPCVSSLAPIPDGGGMPPNDTCPCYNFEANGSLIDAEGNEPAVFSGLCTSNVSPASDWTFSYFLFDSPNCNGVQLNDGSHDFVCFDAEDLRTQENPNQSVEALEPGLNTNRVVCITATAAKTWNFESCAVMEVAGSRVYDCACTPVDDSCDCGAGGLTAGDLEEGCGFDGSCRIVCGMACDPAACDDANECTNDTCEQGACAHPPVPAGQSCAGGMCDGAGACVPECMADGDCDDSNECRNDVCALGVCQHFAVPEGELCDIGACNSSGMCTSSCVDGSDCGDGNTCTNDVCTQGVCSNPPVVVGVPCEGGLCDASGTCSPACMANPDCDDFLECTTDVCTTGVCSNSPVTAGEPCMGGTCNDSGVCAPDCTMASTCDDGNECTDNLCTGGTCTHPALDAGTPCSLGACDGAGFCVVCLSDGDCDDTNVCTNDSCVDGDCQHTPVPGQTCPSGLCNSAGTCGPLPFRCDDTKYVLTGNPSTLNVLDAVSGALDPIGVAPLLLNGIGIRPSDGFIYAVSQRPSGTQSLFRITADGAFLNLGAVAGLTGPYPAGAFLADGSYMVFNGNANRFAVIDVGSATIARAFTPPQNEEFLDFAINPVDNTLWAYGHTSNALGRIDPTTGAFTRVFGPVFPPGNTEWRTGSAFFDQTGTLFLYASPTNNPASNIQNRLYSVNLSNGAISAVVTGPTVTDSDGASCSPQQSQ